MSEKRWVFYFQHGTRRVGIGPHESEVVASEAFQFRFGYWPESAYYAQEWTGGAE